jgi:hypothetical protein
VILFICISTYFYVFHLVCLCFSKVSFVLRLIPLDDELIVATYFYMFHFFCELYMFHFGVFVIELYVLLLRLVL